MDIHEHYQQYIKPTCDKHHEAIADLRQSIEGLRKDLTQNGFISKIATNTNSIWWITRIGGGVLGAIAGLVGWLIKDRF